MNDLILSGSQAYSPEEWAREQKRRDGRRAWYAAHREERRTYNREWMRAHRPKPRLLVASLHSLACTGPLRRSGCVCRKIKLYAA